MSDNEKSCRILGMELIEIKPIILGGKQGDADNKTMVTRKEHFAFVRYWNNIIKTMDRGQ